MKYELIELENKTKVVRMKDESIVISDEQSFLDVFMTILMKQEKIGLSSTKTTSRRNFLTSVTKSQAVFCKR